MTSRVRVLVIDDDDLVRRSVARWLKRHHDVVDVVDSASALALLQSGERFAMILVDLHLPDGLTGPELLEGIARIDREQVERVVFHTGGPASAEERSFLARQKVILKGASHVAIEAALERLVGRPSSSVSASART
jgi:CheY-like chemotaxis protein